MKCLFHNSKSFGNYYDDSLVYKHTIIEKSTRHIISEIYRDIIIYVYLNLFMAQRAIPEISLQASQSILGYITLKM